MSRIQNELKATFDVASLRREAASSLNHTEWRKLRNITDRFDKQRRAVDRIYKLDYDTLMDSARQKVMADTGQPKSEFKWKFLGKDQFNKDVIEKRAHTLVHRMRNAEMTELDRQEATAIRTLVDGCQERKALREKPQKDFARAADRRMGQDRRRSRD